VSCLAFPVEPHPADLAEPLCNRFLDSGRRTSQLTVKEKRS
jgi:hypothetical protein